MTEPTPAPADALEPEASDPAPALDPGDGATPDPPPGNPVVRVWRAARSRWWSRWLMEIALVVAVFWAIIAFQSRHLLDDGMPAPDMQLQDLDGNVHRLSDYQGKKVLLAFWAPWCSVCGIEASNWRAVDEDMDNVVVLSIALSYEELSDVTDFVEEHDLQGPILLGSPNIAETYAVTSFPTMYVLDEEGRIEHAFIGYTTTAGLKMRLSW